MSHCSLEQAEREIKESKEEVEHRLGKTIRGFAFPYGYDPAKYARFVPILKKHRLDYACASWWGNNNKNSNLYVLLRNVLPPRTSSAIIGRELHLNMAE
jgi:hypothetical protein